MRFFSHIGVSVTALLKRPASWLAMAIFALVLGANSALYGVLDFLTRGPLGFQHDAQLISVHNSYPAWKSQFGNVSVPDFIERKRDIPEIEDAAIFYGIGGNLALQGVDPVRITGLHASTSFFSTVGWRPALGRVFIDSDSVPDSPRVMVISDQVWRMHFDSDASIIGRLVQLDGAVRQIVGVLPADAVSVDQNMGNDFFVPVQLWPKMLTDEERGSDHWRMFARIKPGVAPGLIAKKSTELFARYARAAGGETAKTFIAENQGASAQSLRTNMHGEALKNSYLLSYALLGVLLIACANIANLLSAQVIERGRELAVRSAMGANTRQIFTAIVLEGAFIAGVASLFGLLIGHFLLPITAKLLIGVTPIAPTLRAGVFVGSVALGLASGVLASVLAAWVAMCAPLNTALRSAGRSMSASSDLVRLRRWLSGVQIALSIALLAVALSLVRDFSRRDGANNGFVSAGVQTMKINLGGPAYRAQTQRNQFLQALDSKLRALPNVAAVSLSQHLPFNGSNWNSTYRSVFTTRDEQMKMVVTGPGLFDTLRIPLKAGRDFLATDARGEAKAPSEANDAVAGNTPARQDVVVLDEQAALTLLGSVDVIGKSIQRDSDKLLVVGLVGNVERVDPGQPSQSGTVYMPSYQVGGSNETHIAIRPVPGKRIALDAVRKALAMLNPGLPLFDVRSLDDMRQSQLQPQRLMSNVSAALSGLALLLAMVGTFGVMAFAIERRRNEFGVRLALGASERGIVALVLKEGAGLLTLGCALGLPLALIAQKLLAERLNGLALDGVATAGAVIAIACAALAACALPAIRAKAVSPLLAMRLE